VIICDSESDDGSEEILEEYSKKGLIKLIVQKCTRGRGRQIAFENSRGRYIISGIDMDDVLKPHLKDFIRFYHENFEGRMLSARTIHIIPRHIVEKVNGWRDMQYYEDVDFCRRVESVSGAHEYPYVLKSVSNKAQKGFIRRLSDTYHSFQGRYRIGMKISDGFKDHPWYLYPLLSMIALSALVMFRIKNIKKYDYDQR